MFKTRYPIPGQAPATLTPHLIDGKGRKPRITLVQYDEATLEEREIADATELLSCFGNEKISWINIEGLGDVDALQLMGKRFGLHPLALEDVLNTGQRPKTELWDEYLFIVTQMVYQDAKKKMVGEQVSMFLGKNFLITVQEEAEFDVFGAVRVRIRDGRGQIRKAKADYLAYALLDSIIDNYYPVLEHMGSAIEEVEDGLLDQPSREMVHTLHEYKRTLTQLRRFIWPVRDVVNSLLHDQTGHITDNTKLYLRDCYDHTVQLMDLVESYRDVTSGLMELYLSSVGLRTNEIMRVLTVITSIFIPLTFVAGIYGMNFAPAPPEKMPFWMNMPELYSPYGYVGALAVMVIIAAIQLIIFKKKKWL